MPCSVSVAAGFRRWPAGGPTSPCRKCAARGPVLPVPERGPAVGRARWCSIAHNQFGHLRRVRVTRLQRDPRPPSTFGPTGQESPAHDGRSSVPPGVAGEENNALPTPSLWSPDGPAVTGSIFTPLVEHRSSRPIPCYACPQAPGRQRPRNDEPSFFVSPKIKGPGTPSHQLCRTFGRVGSDLPKLVRPRILKAHHRGGSGSRRRRPGGMSLGRWACRREPRANDLLRIEPFPRPACARARLPVEVCVGWVFRCSQKRHPSRRCCRWSPAARRRRTVTRALRPARRRPPNPGWSIKPVRTNHEAI